MTESRAIFVNITTLSVLLFCDAIYRFVTNHITFRLCSGSGLLPKVKYLLIVPSENVRWQNLTVIRAYFYVIPVKDKKTTTKKQTKERLYLTFVNGVIWLRPTCKHLLPTYRRVTTCNLLLPAMWFTCNCLFRQKRILTWEESRVVTATVTSYGGLRSMWQRSSTKRNTNSAQQFKVTVGRRPAGRSRGLFKRREM